MSSKVKRSIIHYFPVYGCFSTGLVYAGIGVIALLSFFKIRDGGADEGSMLAIINAYLVGKIFIWIILTGTMCYVIWRYYEAATDPYGYGKHAKGILKRVSICLSTLADLLIAYTAVRVVLGVGHFMLNGQPREEQRTVASMLEKPWGGELVVTIGVLVIFTAGAQLVYGVTKGYKERIDMDHFSKGVQTFTHFMAWFGYAARGVILGIIGLFLAKAGATGNPQLVVNTDKAFDFIGDHIGHAYFIAAATGTICYGAFMFILGIAYDVDKD